MGGYTHVLGPAVERQALVHFPFPRTTAPGHSDNILLRMLFPFGTKVSYYELRALLGTGAAGEVYRAHDIRLGRDVALKMLRWPSDPTTDETRRFQQESLVVAKLNHPNIPAIYDVGPMKAIRTSFQSCWTAKRYGKGYGAERCHGRTSFTSGYRWPMPSQQLI
jgi:serine/threonine protein kinase